MFEKIAFENLPQNEQLFLTQVYGSQKGYNLKKIQYVKELSDDEKIFFEKNNFVSPNFFVQKLYKVAGDISPLKFNLAVSKLIEHTDELRTNFCTLDNRVLKVVFENRKELPRIIYRNLMNDADIDSTLQNILEADMRQNFNLRYDTLVHFSVFHTGEFEYAVLITMPKLIEDSFEVKNLFHAALELENFPPKKIIKLPYKETPAPVMNYWTNILQELPLMPKLPFSITAKNFYKQRAYRMTIPTAIMSDLREKAKSNKMMLMSIFQTAWAILLQEFNKTRDIVFSTLVPEKTSEDINSMPVRLKFKDEETLQDLVKEEFKQLMISQPYAMKNFSAINNIIKPQNKTFDHFLSFGDFMKDEQLFSTAEAKSEGTLVLQNSWNSQNSKLGLYFNYKENTTSITILFDENKFVLDFGTLLSRRYFLILQQMILDWNLNYKIFSQRLAERFKAEPSPKENDEVYLQNFISQLELLQGGESGNLNMMMQISKLKTYFEGDRISEEDMENNLIFVAEGKLSRSLEAGDGWYNSLDVVKENRWINETVLLTKRKSKMSAEILTEKAILMFIPLEKMDKILNIDFGLNKKFLLHVLGEMEKYQKLWIQS